jgi:hypothetical protein
LTLLVKKEHTIVNKSIKVNGFFGKVQRFFNNNIKGLLDITTKWYMICANGVKNIIQRSEMAFWAFNYGQTRKIFQRFE